MSIANNEGARRILKLLTVTVWLSYSLLFLSMTLKTFGNEVVYGAQQSELWILAFISYTAGGFLLFKLFSNPPGILQKIGYLLFSLSLIISGIAGIHGNVNFFIPFSVLTIFSGLTMIGLMVIIWIVQGFKSK